jgi:hypothetical protein
MRPSSAIALAAALLTLAACDDIVDSVNLDRGAVEVENGTPHRLQRLYHPPCNTLADGDDRLDDREDLLPGEVLEVDLPNVCLDIRADFSDGRRRVITQVTPDPDQRQRITFR